MFAVAPRAVAESTLNRVKRAQQARARGSAILDSLAFFFLRKIRAADKRYNKGVASAEL
jgi:hypothetical protein